MRINQVFGFSVLALLLLIGVVQIGYYCPQMPARMASSFDAHGRAEGWMSPGAFALFHTALLVVLLMLVLLMRFLFPRLPVSLINMPNRDYWLAPERRAETDAIVFGYLLWFFNATIFLVSLLIELVYLQNLGYPDMMRWCPWALLAGYMVFAAVWSVLFCRRFSRVPP